MRKISELLSENFQFLVVKFSMYLNRRVFVMISFCHASTGVINRPCSMIVSLHGHLFGSIFTIEPQ